MSQNAAHPSGVHFADTHVMAQLVSMDLIDLSEEYRAASRNTRDQLRKGLTRFFREMTSGSPPVAIVKDFDMNLVAGDQSICPFTGLLLSASTAIHLRRVLRLMWKNESLRPDQDILPEARERLRLSGSPGRGAGKLLLRYITRLLRKIPVPHLEELELRHGPGAVACGERGLEKWSFNAFFKQWISYGCTPQLLHYNDRHWISEPHTLELLEHPVTRVIQVPKDIRGDRVISIEAKEMMFLQQGLCKYLMPRLERASHGEIKFEQQDAHRSLLRHHGLTVATLDLKDASDLVSRRLVWNAFPKEWRRLLFTLRSHATASHDADVPTPLRAYAPMGSALCFVVEAIVHWACMRLAIDESKQDKRNVVLSVYGDDIIISAPIVIDALRALRVCGLKPNTAKCCYMGSFRETCGLDCLFTDTSWQDATCVYIKADFGNIRVSDVPGLIQQANKLHSFGHERMALYVVACLIASPHGRLVWRGSDTYHIQFDCDIPLAPIRYNHNYQYLEHRVLGLIPYNQCREKPDGWNGLFSGISADGRASEVSYTPSSDSLVKCRWHRRG